MEWPDGIVRDTGLELEPGDSGKPRLRSNLSPRVQIGRILSSMLMLPDPTRSFKDTPASWPIIAKKQYAVTQVGFSPESDFAEMAERVTFAPSWIQVANQANHEPIGVEARWRRIFAVYDRVLELPTAGLQSSVTKHRDYIATGSTVKFALTTIVTGICRELAAFGSVYAAGTDPLPALESILSIAPPSAPSLPPPDKLGEDEPEISARSAHEWRLSKVRGASGRKFSEAVRAAYNYRCAFCGGVFGGLEGIRSGIDAAHILAWSKHDLDVVSNGIALCKLHHWAFDAGIMVPVKKESDYFVRFTVLAELLDEISLARLGADGTQIPAEWLPADTTMRPSTTYLGRLYADLGVTFSDPT